MLTVEVKNTLGVLRFDGAFPKKDFESGIQKEKDGVPLWQVVCLLRQPDSNVSDKITVVIPAQKNPSEFIEPFAQIGFENLRILTGEQNGRTWVAFHADKVGLVK